MSMVWNQMVTNMTLPQKLPSILCLLCVAVSLLFITLTSRQALFFATDAKSPNSYLASPNDHNITAIDPPPSTDTGKMGRVALQYSKTTPVNKLYSSSSFQQQNQLLLVTLGRSGSSFTSSLISHDSSVFYMFEPLFVLQKLLPGHLKGNITAFSNRTVLHLFESFLSCNFRHSNVSFLNNFQLRLSGLEMKRFFTCTMSVSTGLRHIECFLKLIDDCQQKKTIFAKTIRLSMSLAEELMRRLPNLKILYLIRDPRAVLRSQASVFHNFRWPQDLDSQAKKHCDRIADDLAAIDRMSGLLPGRIRLIRYESGALDPVSYVKDIYGFAGLNFTKETLARIQAVTRGKGSPEELKNPYGLVRANTTEAANHWRSQAYYVNVKSIDKVCAKIYSRFGYKEVTSREHLHSNKPLFEPVFKQEV